jgi:hypothetical protein
VEVPKGQEGQLPIKRSTFDAALEVTPVLALREVVLRPEGDRSPSDFFWAVGIKQPTILTDDSDWLPPATAVWAGLDQEPQLVADIRIYAVPPDRRHELTALFSEQALPTLLRWIQSIGNGPQTGRTETRRLAVFYLAGQVRMAESRGHFSHQH